MSTETKVETHTPGPWNFAFCLPEEVQFNYVAPEDDPDGLGWNSKTISICNQNQEILAEVKVYDTKGFLRDFNQFEANARLIAASPSLLEALEAIMSEIDNGRLVRNIDKDHESDWAMKNMNLVLAMSKAVKAINNARGL